MKTFSALPALCVWWIPSQRPVMWSVDAFFELRLNKRLSKKSRRRWVETPVRSLWRYCDGACALHTLRTPLLTLLDSSLLTIYQHHLHDFYKTLFAINTYVVGVLMKRYPKRYYYRARAGGKQFNGLHCNKTRWPPFRRRHFQVHFLHSRLIPMYNARFILWPPSLSSPFLIRYGKSTTVATLNKKGVAYRYQATVIFLTYNMPILIQISLKLVPLGTIERKPCSIGSGKGLVPNRRQAITWTNNGPVPWCMYMRH